MSRLITCFNQHYSLIEPVYYGLKCKSLFEVCSTVRRFSFAKPLLRLEPVQTTRSNGSESWADDLLENTFTVKRVLLLKKITRYGYEKQVNAPRNEEHLREILTAKGSDYHGLLQRHDEYYASVHKIEEYLCRRDIEYLTVDRLNYDEAKVRWADLILTAGGDGTFLQAASKVKGRDKPILGINTDPVRSEGYLCMPKHRSIDFSNSIDRVLERKFRWTWRQRIRTTMSGLFCEDEPPVNLHDQQLHSPMEHLSTEHEHDSGRLSTMHRSHDDDDRAQTTTSKVLPLLALNEVFLGEAHSARVSFYEVSIDGSESVRQKSSGLTLCTGTGSTSWFFNINHIPKQSVKEILAIGKKLDARFAVDLIDGRLVSAITDQFNRSLRFDPRDRRMAYVVRDPVVNGIFQVANPRGFCSRMSVKSRMWDAWLVMDGGQSYRFNDGSIATFEVHPQDELRCLQITDDR